MLVFCSASRNDTPSFSLSCLDDLEDLFNCSCGASPIDGSSSRIILGRLISARPMAHICCSPPDV
jgi:hypothetical protein